MIIRPYRPSDYGQVEELWKSTGIYTVERGDTQLVIEKCNRAGGRFLVMEDENLEKIAGTSWMTYDGRRIYLHHFAIAPDYQGKGFGRMLALESLKFPREVGCPVKLEVHRNNLPALKLYTSLGFSEFEHYGIFMNLDPGAFIE